MKPFIYAHVLSDNTGSIYLGCDDKSAVEASAELEGCSAEVIELYRYSDYEALINESKAIIEDQSQELYKRRFEIATLQDNVDQLNLMYERASRDGIAEAHKCFDLQSEIDTLRDALKDVLDWIDASSSRTALEKIVKQALNK